MGWTTAVPESIPPAARRAGAMIFDRLSSRFVLFGGATASDSASEVWTFDNSALSTWKHLTPSGSAPSARVGASAIYDPIRHRMLVTGGDYANGAVYALSLATGAEAWSVLVPSGSGPGGRKFHRVIFASLFLVTYLLSVGFAAPTANRNYNLPACAEPSSALRSSPCSAHRF